MQKQRKQVAVYAADRKTLIGYVHQSCTSIGASKIHPKGASMQYGKVNGSYAWIASI